MTNSTRLLTPADLELGFWCPQPVDRTRSEARLDRFPSAATACVRGQIGPLANIRSSAGCAVVVDTNAPWVELLLERLRHHQLVSQCIAIEIEGATPDQRLHASSDDLREHEGSLSLRFPTGLERSGPCRRVWLWMPTISTAAVKGVLLPADAHCQVPELPLPQWLAIGDSLTQGFSVAVPTQNWVHRCAQAWNLPVWNLGVGGLQIEPDLVQWALEDRDWPLVTIALGSNHSWREADVATVAERAQRLAGLALAGAHQRIAWLLPPWKPCEAGQGPSDFAGVPLDRAAGERAERIRAILREVLSPHTDRIHLIDNLGHSDHRWYPDGLHPFALGFAHYAQQVQAALGLAAK